MKRYYIKVIGCYIDSNTTHQVTIDCDGMCYSDSGVYEFWNDKGYKIPVAYYPIRHTIITKVEQLKQDK